MLRIPHSIQNRNSTLPISTRYLLSFLIFILLSEGRAGDNWKPHNKVAFFCRQFSFCLNSSLYISLHLHSLDGVTKSSDYKTKRFDKVSLLLWERYKDKGVPVPN